MKQVQAGATRALQQLAEMGKTGYAADCNMVQAEALETFCQAYQEGSFRYLSNRVSETHLL